MSDLIVVVPRPRRRSRSREPMTPVSVIGVKPSQNPLPAPGEKRA